MILIVFVLFGFGVCDLVRWSRGKVGWGRALLSALAGAVVVLGLAALGGLGREATLAAGAGAFVVLLPWSAFDQIAREEPSEKTEEPRRSPSIAILLVMATFCAAIALSGLAPGTGGDIASWYGNLGFSFAAGGSVPVDQFATGVGAALFLLASANRIVGYALAAANASLVRGEERLRGGRLLGPMERLFVAAGILSGSLAGAGLVIAAKGLLRFREFPAADNPSSGPDESTEYFLIGTFASVLVAAIAGVLVLGTG